MDNTNNTQSVEDTKTETQEVEETQVQEDNQQPEEETLGAILGNDVEEEKPKQNKKPETVPFGVFEELKKELKELKKNQNESKQSVDSTIEDIANQYDLDSEFVGKLANAIKSSTVKEFDEKYSTKLKEFETSRTREQNEKKFDGFFDKTLDSQPYLKGVVNKDIIKELAFNPKNANKTLSQIIEDVYGNSVAGKKTIETAQPVSGSRTEVKVDFTKAGDPAVYAQIKADPELRKQYNEFLIQNLNI